MEYGLTTKARRRDIEDKPLADAKMNKVLLFMKSEGPGSEDHSVVNPDEIAAELGVDDAKSTLDSMVRAGFLWKEETDSGSGGDVIGGPNPYDGF